ncbi:MAG: fumarylacetoacetate hydrolase family protein [Chloroflexi bacterium]|nr:fumarylacetoacetate hydrolase family protein [Chloroflexota bacterium]
MRFVHFAVRGRAYYGIVSGEEVERLVGSPFGRRHLTGERYPLPEVKLLPPTIPSKIIAVGLNYRDHAQEVKRDIPEEPLIFFKAPSALIGHEDTIRLPSAADRIDHEGELVVVIGKRAKAVREQEALSYALGYTCGNDVSNRPIQRKDGQWARAKSFDTFAPVGPWVVDDINPESLDIRVQVNGELRQSSNTSKLIFGVAQVVSFVSHAMTLLPGDLIFTGTPAGIGPLTPGDVVEVIIEGIGTLRNRVALAEGIAER